ncbi:MAG TPA: hypothetical protein VNY80_13465, partial [Steroidobacteraceae bacterium]|nr:hypothetical protein [Steroidobacteraceae bacterium]
DDVAECVEDTLRRVGPHIVLALPLGIGKPNPLANEFYRRARRDPSITLKIFTALSLRAPQWHGELERLFLQPLVERLFGGCVPLDYVTDLHAGDVPDNVQIIEFFLDPGALLNVYFAATAAMRRVASKTPRACAPRRFSIPRPHDGNCWRSARAGS